MPLFWDILSEEDRKKLETLQEKEFPMIKLEPPRDDEPAWKLVDKRKPSGRHDNNLD